MLLKINTVALVVPRKRQINSLDPKALHTDAAVIAVADDSAVFITRGRGIFKGVVALPAGIAVRISARAHTAQCYRLIQKLQIVLFTGLACLLNGEFARFHAAPP